ncbi:magnesium transporter [Halomarina rubra]|uniref:Magnesium transporter n=1 Tax=Halomarina rubra TaxID=2071873 RepID=A0ABD6AVM2_9EURY|nr:magnesium transporter [Halomarina rubra]
MSEPQLDELRDIDRTERHPLIYDVSETQDISRGTLFYVKEYGRGAVVWRTIVRESLLVLILASLVSSVGGLALEEFKTVLFALTPFVVLFPALNDMLGDLGIVISGRYSELLYRRDEMPPWWRDSALRRLFVQVLAAALVMVVVAVGGALSITTLGGTAPSGTTIGKIVLVVFLDVLFLVCVVFAVALLTGTIVYRRGEDPNNVLIPVTTAVADVLNIVVLVGLISVAF